MTPPEGVGERDGAGRIVLSWLIRLRWFAVCGQGIAIAAAFGLLTIRYPLVPLLAVLATTLLTNLGLLLWLRTRATPPRLLAPLVLALDVGLLTVLLYFTGGPNNPFSELYIVHVAMATVVLGPAWAWGIVATAAVCYGLITWRHLPLAGTGESTRIPPWAEAAGQATALLLVVALLAYFIGRVMVALRTRDAELAEVRERARQTEQLAALTTLAAGAAHELGTPLGTIAVVAKELELSARHGGDAATAEDAALIRQQVDRCRGIIDHMRGDVAGRSSDAPGCCEAAEVVRGVIESLTPDRQGRLQVRVEEDVPSIAAPLRATVQAVQFLVNNGFDASGDATTVKLVVSGVDGVVRFEVADSGEGMDAETLRRATEPFFTTKDPGRGMGLGLFLVRLVADRNGGRLSLESTPGVGTTATLELPVYGRAGAC